MPEFRTELPAEGLGETREGQESKETWRVHLIAVAAVVTTLLAALTGYFQAAALSAHDQAEIRAERLGVLSLDAAAGNSDQAQVQVERFQLLQAAERQHANADAFWTYAQQQPARLDAARWQHVTGALQSDTAKIAQQQLLLATCPAASETPCPVGAAEGPQPAERRLPVICSPSIDQSCGAARGQGGWYSPEEDPSFPTRYHQAAQREAYFLSAQRDAYNQRANAAETRFVHLAAGLTVFAVAVFLFGYSLTPQGTRRRRLFTRVASVFVLFGAGWVLYSLAGGIPNPSGPSSAAYRASVAYADGEVAFHDAEYSLAVRDLGSAVRLQPKLVGAWTDFAQANYNAGTPQRDLDNEVTQIPTLASMRADVDADRHAIAAGSESPTVRFDLGATLLYIGLLKHDNGLVRQSRSVSADAAARFLADRRQGRHPGEYLLFAEFNAAEADLADRSPGYRAEYRAAIAQTLSLQNEISPEMVVANALTDLNLVAQTRPKLVAETRAVGNEIVGAVTFDKNAGWNYSATGDNPPPGQHAARLTGIELAPDPGHLQFMIGGASGFNPNRDTLSVQWEYRDPVNGNWEVLPDISGQVRDANTNSLVEPQSGLPYVSSNPSFIGETNPHSCLPPGPYRADLYVNGTLAGESAPQNSDWTRLQSRDFGPLQSADFGPLNVAFCEPGGWRGVPLNADAEAFVSPDRSAGALLFAYPRQALGSMSPAQAMSDVVGFLAGVHNSPIAGASPLGKVSQTSYFMNFDSSSMQRWYYPVDATRMGYLVSAAGASSNNELYVALVFGSASQANGRQLVAELNDILYSYSQL